MNGGHGILQTIIQQSAKGYGAWQVEPMWVAVEKEEKQVDRPELLPGVAQVGSHIYREVSKTIELDNDILVLTSDELDIPINATLILESHDNLFTITKAEYACTSFHKYQAFSNYLKITLKDYGNYVPFQLEFLRVKPNVAPCGHTPPFGHAHGHCANGTGICGDNNENRENDD